MAEQTLEITEEAAAVRGQADYSFPELMVAEPSPHIHHKDRTSKLMLCVTVALLPALIFGIVLSFMSGVSVPLLGIKALTVPLGVNALLLTAFSVVACMVFEWGFEKITRRSVTVKDGSALVTGVLLAMNVPASLPLWQIVLGAFFAMVVVKGLFGGIGKNIVNPALAARAFLFFSYADDMSAFPVMKNAATLDGAAGATPLAALKNAINGSLEVSSNVDITSSFENVSFLDMFLGFKSGCLGELSICLLLAGGVYLLLRRVITWHIPTAYLGTVALITFLFPIGGVGRVDFMLFHLLSGGLVLGALFMATDYATSPVTPGGRLLYGVVCGVITVLIRYFGSYPEGVSFAILIGNLLVYYIDKLTKPRRFGTRQGKKSKEGTA